MCTPDLVAHPTIYFLAFFTRVLPTRPGRVGAFKEGCIVSSHAQLARPAARAGHPTSCPQQGAVHTRLTVLLYMNTPVPPACDYIPIAVQGCQAGCVGFFSSGLQQQSLQAAAA